MSLDITPVLWEKPGPGPWTLDSAHNVGAVTQIVQDLFPSAMAEGFQSFTARYGLPLSHIDVRYVNGYPYGSARIAGVPVSDRPPPPDAILRLLTRVHPVLRRRNRQAVAAVRQRVWRDDLMRWFDELRPARLTSVRALQAIDPNGLDDDALADHLDSCVSQLRDGLREHFSLVGATGVPVGLYMVQQAERGRSPGDAIADLRGAAASSTAATLPALAAVADALAAAGVEPTSFDDIRRASPAAAEALDAYLDEYGQRVVGSYDVTGRRLVEVPDIVLRSIVAAGRRVTSTESLPADGDPVVDDARLAVASHDDHSGISSMWPLGLLRRALLAVGTRLHAAGQLDDPEHTLDGRSAELIAMLRRQPGAPVADVFAERARNRHRFAAAEPPSVLGTLHAPPSPSLFPAGLRRMSMAMGMFLGALETTPVDNSQGDRDGVGVGDTLYRGRAVVAASPEDAYTRLEPGDVLVTLTTTTAFNCVLPIVGALVTVHGGLMSHAGIASRELGIPAVLGVRDALDRIPDGAQVEVDPVACTVRMVP